MAKTAERNQKLHEIYKPVNVISRGSSLPF